MNTLKKFFLVTKLKTFVGIIQLQVKFYRYLNLFISEENFFTLEVPNLILFAMMYVILQLIRGLRVEPYF